MYQSIINNQNLISLDEASHTYTLKNSNIEFKSVTEFIGLFFHPFDEIKIANKLIQMDKYHGQSVNDILTDWENRRRRGTIVHQEIESAIISSNELQYLNFKSEEFQNIDTKSKQALLFLAKCNIYKNNTIFPEVKVYSKELQLAGTIDLMIYNKPKNSISLVDWKTNIEIKRTGYKQGLLQPTKYIDDCSFNKYELQLSMYQYILSKFYNAKVNGLYIVHLKDDNFKPIKCSFQEEKISEMIEFHKNKKIEKT
tara:strand:+ start:678 stop:1439 length:762 start_codon:yes stop_codon:yes gene_type:complete